MYKWSKFILLSSHSAENKARQKFNRLNILPLKFPIYGKVEQHKSATAPSMDDKMMKMCFI